MKPLFIYKKSVKPSGELLAELREAGFIPVPVKDMNDVKISVGFNMPSQDGMFLLKSALEAIREAPFDHATHYLGKLLIKEAERQIEEL